MTSPVAGALVRHLLTGADPPFIPAPFTLSRFDDRTTEFPFRSISAGGDPE